MAISKVDAILSAQVSQTLSANTTLETLVTVNTLADSTIFQVFEVVALEVNREGSVLTGANPVKSNIQLLTKEATNVVSPFTSDPEFIAQFGHLFGAGSSALQERVQLSLPVMIVDSSFKVCFHSKSVAAGALDVQLSIYGNYRRLSEVEYLRLTCGD